MIVQKTIEIDISDQEVRELVRQTECPFHQAGMLVDLLNVLTIEKIQKMCELMDRNDELPILLNILTIWKNKNG